MKNAFLSLLICFCWTLGQAQDVHIYYDVFKDSITYQVNGQVVERPLLKKGNQLILHVQNYNDYIYKLKVDTKDTNYTIGNAGMEGSLMSGGNTGVLSQLKGMLGTGTPLENMIDNSETGIRDGFGTESTAVMTSQMRDYQSQFQTAMSELTTLEKEVRDIDQDIEADVQGYEFNSFMQKEAISLRNNVDLPPNKIKELTMEYVEQILDLDKRKKFDLKDLFERQNLQADLKSKVEEYETEVGKMDRKLKEVQLLRATMLALEYPEVEKAKISLNVEAVEAKTKTLNVKVDTLKKQIPKLSNWNIKELASIRYLYEEMKEHQFEKTIILTPETDMSDLTITLIPTDSAKAKNLVERKLNPIKIQTYGGLKVNASVGISFASYFERPQNYLVRDGIIIGDDLDAFSPVITSFVHFYGEGKKQTTVGGTFGFGVSLGGENSGLQNYFLGPSLIMGKSQRVVLTTGVMGGQVNRISSGYNVGDALEGETVPTRSGYELGAFFGVSFNIGGN